jgi:hypothetical protein
MTRQTNARQNGHVVLAAIIGLIVVLAGFLAWQYVRSQNDKNKEPSQPTPMAQTEPAEEQLSAPKISDPSEGGKYLFIKEWNMRGALPAALHGKVTYSLGEPTLDPDGNRLQATKIFVLAESLPGSVCAATNTAIGSAIDSAAQYIRSEKGKPFNTQRYKQTFKENVGTDNQYNYHLNYVTPPCLESASNAEIVQSLQAALATFQEAQ